MLAHDSIIWRLERSHKSKAHSLLPSPALLPLNPEKQAPASRFAYDSSCAISETTGDLSEEKIALIEATQSNRSRQHRCKRGRHFFSFLVFFFEASIGAFRKVCQTTSVAFWNSCLKRCGGRAHTSGFSDSLESVKRMTLVLLLALNSQRRCTFWRAEGKMEGWEEERWRRCEGDESSCSGFSLPSVGFTHFLREYFH